MSNLTLLEEESLGILRQLEYCCDRAEQQNSKEVEEKKYLEISYVDIDFSVLKKPIDICEVEGYLRENGLDFRLTLDFINDDPTILEVSNNPLDIYTQLGIINGNNIEDIKKKIKISINRVLLIESKKEREAKNTLLNFYFNKSNGELSLYPKEMNKTCSFAVNKGRYKIITILIEEKNIDNDFYISTDKIAQDCGYKDNQKCREGIHAIRGKVEKTFTNIKGDEFIEVKQPDGYRIGKKISLSFEDTP